MSLPQFTAQRSLKRSRTTYVIENAHSSGGITQQSSCADVSTEASLVCDTRGRITSGTNAKCTGTRGEVYCGPTTASVKYCWTLGNTGTVSTTC
jgi:hypothetical protein